MRYAIISDIHGNREALDACLSDARHQSVDAVLCLERPDRIRSGSERGGGGCEEADIIVGGNHDAGAVINLDLFEFNPYARASIEWTRGS